MNNNYFKVALYFPICMAIFVTFVVLLILDQNPKYKLVYRNAEFESEYISGNYIWPAKGFYKISSYFGKRKSPTAGASSYHNGVDILANQGTSVCSIQNGKVIFAGFSSSGGYMVKIQHENNIISSYCHLDETLYVKKGDIVKTGEMLGKVGPKYLSNGKLNGATTGVHLHFAIQYNGKYIDPLEFFNF